MSKSFGEYVEDIHEQFDKISDAIEERSEDFTEGTREIWQVSKLQLTKLKKRLDEAAQNFHSSSDEARVQAHLAAMDAQDHWQSLKMSIESLAAQAQRKAQPGIDHVALQAHLAKMNARDFMAEKGHDLAKEFKQSMERSQQLSSKAAADIKASCDGIIAGLPK
jgi:ABC-type transporter Mla subunit MlaD